MLTSIGYCSMWFYRGFYKIVVILYLFIFYLLKLNFIDFNSKLINYSIKNPNFIHSFLTFVFSDQFGSIFHQGPRSWLERCQIPSLPCNFIGLQQIRKLVQFYRKKSILFPFFNHFFHSKLNLVNTCAIMRGLLYKSGIFSFFD